MKDAMHFDACIIKKITNYKNACNIIRFSLSQENLSFRWTHSNYSNPNYRAEAIIASVLSDNTVEISQDRWSWKINKNYYSYTVSSLF